MVWLRAAKVLGVSDCLEIVGTWRNGILKAFCQLHLPIFRFRRLYEVGFPQDFMVNEKDGRFLERHGGGN